MKIKKIYVCKSVGTLGIFLQNSNWYTTYSDLLNFELHISAADFSMPRIFSMYLWENMGK